MQTQQFNLPTSQITLLKITNPHFAQGYQRGSDWYALHEWDEPMSDEYLIQTITAMSERQAHKLPNDMAWHIGFIFGMVRMHLCE